MISGGCYAKPPPVLYAKDAAEGVGIAASADVAVVFVSTSSSEGGDRPNLSYGSGDDLIEAIAAVQPNTVVVAVSPGAVLLPWADKVAAILMPFMPGQMFADALADLLFGEVGPRGRLPITMPNKENEMQFSAEQYPGVNEIVQYSEGLFVGYRWYDAHGVTPRFCFGHGLSYTNFSYTDLNIAVAHEGSAASVSLTLTNTGSLAGHETPQLYIGFPENTGEPPKVLRSFQQVHLGAGESQSVTLSLDMVDLSIWDVTKHQWSQPDGEFTAMVGASSCDIRLSGAFVPSASVFV